MIRYFDKGGLKGRCLDVEKDTDFAGLLNIHMNGSHIYLNPLQVDKLRQQLHGWLHRQANSADGLNWEER